MTAVIIAFSIMVSILGVCGLAGWIALRIYDWLTRHDKEIIE